MYLECSNDKCHKFYEIRIEKTTIISNFGRIGTKGRSIIYTFTNKSEQDAFFTKIIALKRKKGYEDARKGQRFFRPIGINPRQLQLPFYLI